MKRDKVEKQAARVFLRAATYIRRYGWQEKGMNVHGRPRCSMGALASAAPQQKWDSNLANLMYEVLQKELSGLSLTQFNHRYRSGEKVAQLYERTARKLLNGV